MLSTFSLKFLNRIITHRHLPSLCLSSLLPEGFSQASHELRAADKVVIALDSLVLRDIYSVSGRETGNSETDAVNQADFLMLSYHVMSCPLRWQLSHLMSSPPLPLSPPSPLFHPFSLISFPSPLIPFTFHPLSSSPSPHTQIARRGIKMSQGPDQQTETASAPIMSITRSVSAPAKTEDRVSTHPSFPLNSLSSPLSAPLLSSPMRYACLTSYLSDNSLCEHLIRSLMSKLCAIFLVHYS